MPASNPTVAPSPAVIGAVSFCCSTYAATTPPTISHMQQHTLPAAMNGSPLRTPMIRPPTSAGCVNRLVVVLTAKVRNQLFALEISQRVLQLHQLDEQIVLGVDLSRRS